MVECMRDIDFGLVFIFVVGVFSINIVMYFNVVILMLFY